MFVGTQIYIRCVVISIFLIAVMIAIELFYLTKICTILECFFVFVFLDTSPRGVTES